MAEGKKYGTKITNDNKYVIPCCSYKLICSYCTDFRSPTNLIKFLCNLQQTECKYSLILDIYLCIIDLKMAQHDKPKHIIVCI